MTFKSILTHVEPTPDSDRRLAAAAAFAETVGAVLTGVGGREPAYIDTPWAYAYPDGRVVEAVIEREKAEVKEAEARFLKATQALGSRRRWRVVETLPGRAFAGLAAGADLIIASAVPGPAATSALPADIVLRSGVPVLTLPAEASVIRTASVIVAWKNCREAQRALTDSLSLLERAATVSVVHVGLEGLDEDGVDTLDEVVERLRRHGVAATGVRLNHAHGDPADTLMRYADAQSADLIVAGAYGHSRLREWALGGFTKALLHRSLVPLLFSH